MDLKYINQNVLLFKIGKVKIPAYALIWLLIWLVIQNFLAFYIFIIMFVLSSYLETKQISFKVFIYIFRYLFQKKVLFVSKKFKINEKFQNNFYN